MLEFLRIRHLALIDDMELEFSDGLNTLTGETGAGKSFILKALNFLTGDKMGTDLVRPGKEKALAEALFVRPGHPEGDLIVRRELSAATGRSRLYINDKLSSQETIRELRPSLLVHTSQHGQQQLLHPSFQGKLLDRAMDKPDLVSQRHSLVRRLKEIATEQEELNERSRQLADKREFLEFQQQEIDKVAPEAGEEDLLDAKKQELRNQTVLQETVDRALTLVSQHDGGVLYGLNLLERELDTLCSILPEYRSDASALTDFKQLIQDLEGRLRRQPIQAEGEESLEEIESRLFELAQLKRKLRRSLDEIMDLQEEIQENLSFLDACGLDMARLSREEQEIHTALATALEELNASRREAGATLCASIATELKGLGFSEHVDVRFEFTQHELAPGCIEDRAHLMWIPNPGQPPQPLDKIASGGELSRFLLAVVGLMHREEAPTLIFDEVDAGVGGITLNHMADKLASLALRQQVVLITHWPQLAARAKRHFQVCKEVQNGATFTRCVQLTDTQVHAEIVRMAGGGDQGAAMARELLTQHNRKAG